jgi:hypothetical protein
MIELYYIAQEFVHHSKNDRQMADVRLTGTGSVMLFPNAGATRYNG